MSLQEAVNTKAMVVSTLAAGTTGSTAKYWIDAATFSEYLVMGTQMALFLYTVSMVIINFPKVIKTIFPPKDLPEEES